MDSITQITLGAAVGEAAGGREYGYKAPLWGAALGTLPDLDVLADPFLTEAQALLFHRGPSHSLLFVALITPLVAAALTRIHRHTSWRRWALLIALVLLTHIGLDCLTAYGTQVFWPFSRTPVIVASIFIIDPLYTLPLATGLLVSFRWSKQNRYRRWVNYAGLGLSTAYLLVTLLGKVHVENVFDRALAKQSYPTERVFTRPTAFNSLLWMGISEGKTGFYVGYYSVFDEDPPVSFRYVPKRHVLLGDAIDNPFVERLRWFSRGYFIVRRTSNGSLTIQDLRFGRNDLGLTDDGEYIFTFRLHQDENGNITGFTEDQPDIRLTPRLFQKLGARILGQPASPDAR